LKLTIPEAQYELDHAWTRSYSPERNERVIELLEGRGLDARAMHFVMRLFFRGIYFPQMNKAAWVKLLAQNRKPILKLIKQGIQKYRAAKAKGEIDGLAQPT
jgi:hypothetical protein